MTARRRRDFLEAGILILLALFLHIGGLALRAQTHLAEKVVRLHVLANSDKPEDQALKLRVRDAILARAGELLDGAQNRSEAEARLRRALPELRQAAQSALAGYGWYGPVSARVRESTFPTRQYGGFALPAGRYLALQIVIGEGNGQNWWCVVFPPLCTAAATDHAQAPPDDTEAAAHNAQSDGAELDSAVFSAGEIRLMTEDATGYVLKFKVVEWWEKAREVCAELF